jgi:hypothetical protein
MTRQERAIEPMKEQEIAFIDFASYTSELYAYYSDSSIDYELDSLIFAGIIAKQRQAYIAASVEAGYWLPNPETFLASEVIQRIYSSVQDRVKIMWDISTKTCQFIPEDKTISGTAIIQNAVLPEQNYTYLLSLELEIYYVGTQNATNYWTHELRNTSDSSILRTWNSKGIGTQDWLWKRSSISINETTDKSHYWLYSYPTGSAGTCSITGALTYKHY